jgi:hypothetical protein
MLRNQWNGAGRLAAAAVCLFATGLASMTSAWAVVCPATETPPPLRPPVVIRLEPYLGEPAVVYKTDALTLYIRPRDLLGASPGGRESPLARVLNEPLEADVTVEELIERASPPVPDEPETRRSEKWALYRMELRILKSDVKHAVARLLHSGRMAARDPKTGAAVTYIQREEEGACYVSAVYSTPEGVRFFSIVTTIP